jgi:uncharacterized membrane protein
MDSLQAIDAKCACGQRVYVLKREEEQDSVICLDCGNGMFKTSFDADTGGWLAGWMDRPTMLRLRKLAGAK